MNDDKRTPEERIAAAARDLYNAPSETPREEMWRAIEARLTENAAAGSTDSAAPDVVQLRSRDRAAGHRPTRRLGWWIGIAAALVIGLGIGRLSMRSGPVDVQTASEQTSETMAEMPAGETAATGPEDPEAGSTDRAVDEAPGRPEARPDTADRLASGDVAAPAPTAGGQAPDGASVGSGRATGLQYAATTRRLLDRGESFLATVQADLASGTPDPEMEVWARSLLSRTRVLMASPAAREPETRRLLQDLELMLAQIVVTTATGDPGEARILGEGLEDGNLLYRLRSAMEEDDGPGGFRAPRTSSL